jgi:heterodisulfide reductase subunit B
VLNADGSVGKLLSASREGAEYIAYECSGKHIWTDTSQA